MSLKESLIQQTEQAVDGLRKRRMTLERDLEIARVEEEEARTMLALLKNGRAPVREDNRKLLRLDDVLAILSELPEEFMSSDMAEALDSTGPTANQWCKRLVKTGHAEMVRQGTSGSSPSIFRKVTDGES